MTGAEEVGDDDPEAILTLIQKVRQLEVESKRWSQPFIYDFPPARNLARAHFYHLMGPSRMLSMIG